MEKALMQTTIASSPLMSDEACMVRDALVARGLETPLIENGLTRDQKFERIKDAFEDIAIRWGWISDDDSLCDTPKRIAKMYVDEVFSGLDYARFPRATAIDNKMGVEEMVRIDDIAVGSTCEHHFHYDRWVGQRGLHSCWQDYWIVESQSHCSIFCSAASGSRATHSTGVSGFADIVGD